jgi:aryl-alcohol dehydrogenase-like predicted oxidoreductase
MLYTTLGATDTKVSKICLGTMTWGEQNTQEDAFRQLDYAIGEGINFIDTAELYAIPAREETYGLTEKIIGNWLQQRGKREDVIIATKVAGPNDDQQYIRGGARYTRQQIIQALEGSLQRLKTDYIDLYQLHWPERKTNYFKDLGYKHDPDDNWQNNFAEILYTLKELINQGKIRNIGISNETPWGLYCFIKLSEEQGLPRIVSVQNPYSLLNRTFEIGNAEIAIREKVGLLAYSPLGAGILTGKYFRENPPEDARMIRWPFIRRNRNQQAEKMAAKYVQLALDNGYKPAQLALAFVNRQPFLTSTIIGATSMEQLKENIESITIDLPASVLEEIEKMHVSQPNPAP